MSLFDKDSYGLPIILATGLHTVILLFAIVGIEFTETQVEHKNDKPIVQAEVIDINDTIIGKRIEEEKKKIAAKVAKEKADQKREEAKKKALIEQKKKLEQIKKAEQARIEQEAKIKKQRQEKEEKAKVEKERQLQQKKRLEEEDRKKKEAERKKAESLEKERQEKIREETRKEEARIAEEKQRRQEEAKKALEDERKLAEKIAAEQAVEAEAQRQRDAEEQQAVQSLKDLIHTRIRNSWNRPPNARNGMKTGLQISFLPSGEINEVFVTQSSGDSLFDEKAVNAVYKVGRIEELADLDSYVFERNFRSIVIIFNPQDLRN